jgi:hypothetical protein
MMHDEYGCTFRCFKLPVRAQMMTALVKSGSSGRSHRVFLDFKSHFWDETSYMKRQNVLDHGL